MLTQKTLEANIKREGFFFNNVSFGCSVLFSCSVHFLEFHFFGMNCVYINVFHVILTFTISSVLLIYLKHKQQSTEHENE